MTYAEGTALLPEAGGSASFARHGFNDMIGFLSGWALMLSYVVTIAISAYTIPPYLGLFWAPLKDSAVIGTFTSMGIIFFLMIMNVIGLKETSFINILATLMDLLVQVLIIILGAVFIFNFKNLSFNVTNYWPSIDKLFLGIALAAIAYTGVETMSQMAEETKQPAKKVPKALILMVITVLLLFGGVFTVGFSSMAPTELASTWSTDPIAGIAYHITQAITPEEIAQSVGADQEITIVLTWIFNWIQRILPVLVAVLAASILLIATNAGLIGISRLAFSLGRYQLIPPQLSRVHNRTKTPFISIILFSLAAIVILIPSLFAREGFLRLGTLYAFGSLLSFIFAHASIISLRIKNPDWHRPFKLGWNIKFKDWEIPISALLGFLGTLVIWIVVISTQPYSRWVGFGWLAIGLLVYIIYRLIKRLPVTGIAKSPTTIKVQDYFQALGEKLNRKEN